MAKITVQNTDISVVKYNEEDYISLTDMARSQLQDEHGNIFAKMNTSAFIVEDKIHAIYENGKLYFQSYTIANQIFSLIDFVTEATNTEIEKPPNKSAEKICNQYSQRKDAIKKKNL